MPAHPGAIRSLAPQINFTTIPGFEVFSGVVGATPISHVIPQRSRGRPDEVPSGSLGVQLAP